MESTYASNRAATGGKSKILTNCQIWLIVTRKHLYDDLRPYTCFLEGCTFSQTPFPMRQQWSDHLELDHQLGPAWNSLECPFCLDLIKPGKTAVLSHFARHMEDVALVALPREVDPEDESEDPSESISNSESEDEPGSGPIKELEPQTMVEMPIFAFEDANVNEHESRAAMINPSLSEKNRHSADQEAANDLLESRTKEASRDSNVGPAQFYRNQEIGDNENPGNHGEREANKTGSLELNPTQIPIGVNQLDSYQKTPSDHLEPVSPAPPVAVPSSVPDSLPCPVPGCEAIFSGKFRRGNLRRHRRMLHEVDTYHGLKCGWDGCTKVYRRTDALKKHRERRHPRAGTELSVPNLRPRQEGAGSREPSPEQSNEKGNHKLAEEDDNIKTHRESDI